MTSVLSPMEGSIRMDAARALLQGATQAQDQGCHDEFMSDSSSRQQQQQQQQQSPPFREVSSSSSASPAVVSDETMEDAAAPGSTGGGGGTSGDYTSSGALDALAALASATSEVINADPHEDANKNKEEELDGLGPLITSRSPSPEEMRPRRMGRLRSVSNPEGMEKWDSMGRNNRGADAGARRHFVLPSSILEEELADAQLACEHKVCGSYIEEVGQYEEGGEPFGTSPNTADTAFLSTSDGAEGEYSADDAAVSESEEEVEEEKEKEEEEEEDLTDVPPEELLRRARARLLEDMSTEHGAAGVGGGGAGKGVLPLPHSLGKYKEVYNKNGRIGIYTPAERAAIIARFQSKRSRRVWKKKIRYNCRKSLADRRVRVKGRFVKRGYVQKTQANTDDNKGTSGGNGNGGGKADGGINGKAKSGQTSETVSSRSGSPDQHAPIVDTEMPDVKNEEAGFDNPTDDQPYRRTRRHTIV